MIRGSRPVELILGLLVGISLGITVAWWIVPISHVDPSPAGLHTSYKDEYRLLVASVYRATGDLGRANIRLSLLKDADPAQVLIDLALRIRSGQTGSALFPVSSKQSVFDLALLANDLQSPPTIQPSSPVITTSPAPAQPTRTYLPFILASQDTICNEEKMDTRARFQVLDSSGEPLPGMEILVTWEAGQQRFYTGLKPELGLGYADFIMVPGVKYTVQIPPRTLAITGLETPECNLDDGTVYTGGLLLVFQQP